MAALDTVVQNRPTANLDGPIFNLKAEFAFYSVPTYNVYNELNAIYAETNIQIQSTPSH
jgi:hypothetical protein